VKKEPENLLAVVFWVVVVVVIRDSVHGTTERDEKKQKRMPKWGNGGCAI
jgi:hypothetical protein